MSELTRKFKFGDIVVNHWAGDKNPLKVSVYCWNSGGNPVFTDTKGKHWQGRGPSSKDAVYQVVGNILSGDNLSELQHKHKGMRQDILDQTDFAKQCWHKKPVEVN